MKGLILAGGRGSRIHGQSHDKNKCMCRFQGRRIIEYSLESALGAGVEEIILLVGYKAETIINELGIVYAGIPIRYVIQWEQRGLVHAMECCQAALDGSDFCMFLADEVLINPRHREMVKEFSDPEIFALCGTVEAEDISNVRKTYAVIIHEETGQVFRLIEKPHTPFNHIQGTGNCIFRSQIFDYIPLTPINQSRKEKELPDLIQCAVDDGKLVKAFEIGSWYANVNTLEELNFQPPAGKKI